MRSQVELTLNDAKLLFLERNNLVRDDDLLPGRDQLDGSRGDVGRQREVTALEHVVPICRLRLQILQLPPCGAENIKGVRHIDVGLIEVRDISRDSRRDGSAADLGTLLIEAGLYLGHEHALLRPDIIPRLSQRRLLGFDVRIACHGRLNQGVELLGTEQRPPLARQVLSELEMLRLAAAHCCCHCLRRQRLGRIGVSGGRRRTLEVRPDGTTGTREHA